MRKTAYFLVTVAAVFAAAALTGIAFGAERPDVRADNCEHILPGEVSHTIAEQFKGWTVQNSAMLSATARVRWQSEKPVACPGVARGRYTGAKSSSFVVLVVGGPENQGHGKLVVFLQSAEHQGAYSAQVLDEMRVGAPNYFIHGAKVRRFFDAASVQRFRVAATDSIVLFDAGTDEYGTEVYFWTETGFHHEPIDH
jgi:hypothetical protein